MDGNPGQGVDGHDRARFIGHPVLDGAGARLFVDVAGDRLAAGAGPLHERGTAERVSAAEQPRPPRLRCRRRSFHPVSPATTTAGSPVTLNGQNFGSSLGSSYLTLAQGGTSWGAPYDGAKVTITGWSDTSVTFTLPPDSGPYPLEPGTATITVTVDGQTSPRRPSRSPPDTSVRRFWGGRVSAVESVRLAAGSRACRVLQPWLV